MILLTFSIAVPDGHARLTRLEADAPVSAAICTAGVDLRFRTSAQTRHLADIMTQLDGTANANNRTPSSSSFSLHYHTVRARYLITT
jgi:hypothetical protein